MLGCTPFLNLISCTILGCGPALVACRFSTAGAYTWPQPHSLPVTFQFCTVKVSQRPLRALRVASFGGSLLFRVRNYGLLANVLQGRKVWKACEFFNSTPHAWSSLQAPTCSLQASHDSCFGMFVPQLRGKSLCRVGRRVATDR